VKKYLTTVLAASALSLGLSGNVSANPVFALGIAYQVIPVIPQVLPIFGGIFNGVFGGNNVGFINNSSQYEEDYEYLKHRQKRRNHQSNRSNRSDNNGY
jgi:hypothetical protein